MNIPWEIWVIAAESIVIVLLLVWLIVASAKQKNKNEIRAHVAEQSRDDRLRTALGNTYATEEIRDTAARNVPFQSVIPRQLQKRHSVPLIWEHATQHTFITQ